MQSAIKHKISDVIRELDLNLKDKTVLTEAATGAYVVTPIIAAAAGAKVFALTKNTRYGTVEDVIVQTKEIANLFNEDLDITIIEKLTPEVLKEIDVITNSGHLRPINKDMLQYVKPETVISYMYEAWEYREGDLDLDFCKQRNIKVAATNERHPNIDVFNYLGELAIKQIHDAGKCLYRNKFIIISNNDFGYHIAKTLITLCESIGVIDLAENKNKYPEGIEWLSDFPIVDIPVSYRDAEAVIFTAYPFEHTWIKEDGELKIESIAKLNNPMILRYAGHVDTSYLKEHDIRYFPDIVKPGHMGILLSEIGYDSVIRLQAGGLKAGELALKNEIKYKGVSLIENI